jgi:5-methylcytosine-specific restriction endonuclease McrA
MKNCKYCGNELIKWQKKYCSRKCSNRDNAKKISKDRIGEGNPMFKKKPWNFGIYGVVKYPKNQGKNCHFWKGGISREKYKLRRGGKWKKWREAVFARDNWTCQKCGKRGFKLHPHHIKLFSYFEKERFDIKNGITLCVKCHKKIHSGKNQFKKIIKIT